jgi:hypothetical protein
MDQTEILAFITQADTEEIDPMGIAKVYAAAVNDMQGRITERDLQRLLLLGAAMFKNSMKGKHRELQMPGSADSLGNLADEQFDGLLH